MKFLVARRRHPVFAAVLLLIALVAVGGIYTAASSVGDAEAATEAAAQTQIDQGRKLYLEGCSSCHGMEAQGTQYGPTLIGVGAAAVDFQVSTGRMPLAAPGVQAQARPSQYNEEETAALAAYVASLGPGPRIPNAEELDYENADVSKGGLLFRTNCAQCHQAAGQGGALTQGKWAPNLTDASAKEIYEAMLTGPENMPVFGDGTITPDDKKSIIKYIESLDEAPSPGGLTLGKIGPVTEGLFLWTAVLGALVVVAVWIGIKAR